MTGSYMVLTATSNSSINQLDALLTFYGIAGKVCAILTIAFLALTVFLFLRFNIAQAILERTGMAKKKSISAMQEQNAMTGRLTKSSGAKIAEQEFQITDDRKKAKRAKRTGDMKASGTSARLTGSGDISSKYGKKFVLTVNQQIVHTDEVIGG